MRSFGLYESDLECLFSEAPPAEHDLVLSDKTFLVLADSAGTRVFSEFTGMRVLLVGHALLLREVW